MSRSAHSAPGTTSFFSGKARTVAAAAAFSGLALATTVSVQAAPAQDSGAEAPLSAVAAATPAPGTTVSLEPVAHVTEEKTEKKAEPKKAEPKEAEQTGAKKAEPQAPAAQPAAPAVVAA
ncbi:C40 family peptidase, partial [Kocuria flava]